MAGLRDPAGWGPFRPRLVWKQRPWVQLTAFAAAFVLWSVVGPIIAVGGVLFLLVVVQAAIDLAHRPRTRLAGRVLLRMKDPLAGVRELARRSGGGIYLGLAGDGGLRFARAERAVVLLGPPRSGKTSAVILPALIAHEGPAVVTSTKTDVAAASWRLRAGAGRVWVFDPTGAGERGQLEELRWSPVTSASSWEAAMLMARAMTAGVGAGTVQGSHWAKRAQALLGPLLHAAALDGRDMEAVVDWVMGHELDQPGIILEQDQASRLAFASLLGIFNTEPRERASIFSAAADALVAYTSEAALEAAKDPNFDASAFVASQDTIYITAPAEEQQAAAPLVCGLLSEVRRATYHAHRHGKLPGRVLLALDEAANIAPLEELPAIASEGGSQGLALLAAFQDLSQARARWGQAAEGFLTLFGTKLILPGIADPRTLEAVSVAVGEYDRPVVSRSRGRTGGRHGGPNYSRTTSTQRTRVIPPGDVANIPPGRALHLDGVAWELVSLTPAHQTEPWVTLTAPPPAAPRP